MAALFLRPPSFFPKPSAQSLVPGFFSAAGAFLAIVAD